MRVVALVVAIACVAASLSPSSSWAQPSSRKATEDKVGRLHYEAGENLYRDERYHAALSEFKAGFALTGRPAFLLNIAQCQRKLGDLEGARENYATYIDAEPRSPRLAEVRELIAMIDVELKARPKKQLPKLEVASAQVVTDSESAPTTPTPALVASAPMKTPVYKKWWLWTTVSVVAVGVGLGVGLGLGLRSRTTCVFDTQTNMQVCQ